MSSIKAICTECGRKHEPEEACVLRPVAETYYGRSVGERLQESEEMMGFMVSDHDEISDWV